MRGNAVWRARLPYDAVTGGTRHVLVRERHLDVVQAHAAQRLEVEAIDVGADEHPAAAERGSPLAEDGAGRARRGNGDPRFEPEGRAAAGGADGEVADVLADRRADERNEGAVVRVGRRNEVIGMERGRRIGAGRPAEEQRVLPARENEELGDLVAEPLGW